MTATKILVQLAVLAGVVACNAPQDVIDQPTSQGAAHLEIASGNNQTGVKSNALASALSVLVTNTNGGPVQNVEVVWSVLSGGGTLDSYSTPTGANGVASVHWTLGGSVGAQSVKAVVAHLSTPAMFAATALDHVIGPPNNTGGSVILHYDGSTWTTSLADNSGLGLSYSSIWGASATKVFAAGKCLGIATVSIYDGNHWSLPTETQCSGGSLSKYTSVWGNSANDVFAVLRNPLPPSLTTNVMRFNGQTWASSLFRACSFCGGYNAVTTSGPNDAIAVGDSGMIMRFDGTNWSAQSSGTFSNLNAVWSAGPGAAVFAVGDGGTIVAYGGAIAGWQSQPSGTTSSLRGVWGTSATDVYAVGSGGKILHFDGTSWSAMSSGTAQDLNSVWGSSTSSVFAVGNASTIVHYDGSSWTAQPVTVTTDLSGIWGASASNIFAVGTAIYPSN